MSFGNIFGNFEPIIIKLLHAIEVLGNNSDNIRYVEFNIHEAKKDIIKSFYEYQLLRGWPSIAKHTGDIVGYDESAIRKFVRRKR